MAIEFLLEIYKVIPNGKGWNVVVPELSTFSWEVSFGDILTLVGMLCSFGAFCWQLHKSRKEQQASTRSRWFLEVVVEPNIEIIGNLYTTLIDRSNTIIKDLNSKFMANAGAQDLNRDVAKYQRELKNLIKDTFDSFQALVGATEPVVSSKLNEKVDGLVDIATKFVDGYESYDENTSAKEVMLTNKQEIISILYKGLN